jgi:hypothetical protein
MGSVSFNKGRIRTKKEVDTLLAKIETLEDAPKTAALERQQTILKWIIAPFGIIIGGWVLFMLTKIGLTPPK